MIYIIVELIKNFTWENKPTDDPLKYLLPMK